MEEVDHCLHKKSDGIHLHLQRQEVEKVLGKGNDMLVMVMEKSSHPLIQFVAGFVGSLAAKAVWTCFAPVAAAVPTESTLVQLEVDLVQEKLWRLDQVYQTSD